MTIKAGARHNKGDAANLQAMHDISVKMGASCGGGKSVAQLVQSLKDLPANMDPASFVMMESWDVSDAAAALAAIANLVSGEAGEPDDVARLVLIMRGLIDFINSEIDDIEAGGEAGEAASADDGNLAVGQVTTGFPATTAISIPSKAKAPDGDFLVVDKDGQHLRVKQNGKPDHNLMGGAWAALHEGYRGNKYEGADKQKAIDKLKALYKSEGMPLPGSAGGKSLDLSYAKSLGLKFSDDELLNKLAVKYIGRDQIKGYMALWGGPHLTDLELEYFTKDTDFWDIKNAPKNLVLTWDHAQDEEFKADPKIGMITDFGDDEVGRWYVAKLDRSHRYRQAIDALIQDKKVGTSSDSAPQYVVREPVGKSTWLKVWPMFAAALTDVPCEPRMIGTPEWFKSLGVQLPDASNINSNSERVNDMLRQYEFLKLAQ